ncbi:hypothetical protein OO013_09575 [Mangrovivirga sp. M17]|uniref:HEPN AbiU2-like domain-containing protein n=1 Tax=Mangrovivirga halotolerans TaxID=2993936 RepID=A0ABT3RSH8_9BACT|nr:hypothetical protein [Mangrovivirga halotolerans]MCX2744115.1 hypothetical protein [Mangrovivirga halotolerans]
MNKITFQELEDWFDNVTNIMTDLNVCISNYEVYFKEEYKDNQSIIENDFFTYHLYQIRFITVVQLSKLFIENKKTHKLNYFTLCNKLINSNYASCLKKQLEINSESNFSNPPFKTKNEIIEEARSIQKLLDDNESLIRNLHDLRDKYYAHTDPNPGLIRAQPYQEMVQLYKLSEFIIKQLFNKILDKSVNFNTNYSGQIENLFNVVMQDD